MSNFKNNRFIIPINRKSEMKSDGISVIILDAGIGYRMKSYGPKSLLLANNQHTILQNTLYNLASVLRQPYEVVLTVGLEADRVIKKSPPGIRIVENQLFETTNQIEELRLALNNIIYNNVLIICGDIIFNENTLECIKQPHSTVVVDSKNRIPAHNIGITEVKDFVSIFAYDIPLKWANMAFLTEKEIKILKSICNNRNLSKLFLYEAFNLLINKKGKLAICEPEGMQIKKIESSKDLV